MGVFSWIFGGSKKAGLRRQEQMQARVQERVLAAGRRAGQKALDWAEKQEKKYKVPTPETAQDQFDKIAKQVEKEYEYLSIEAEPWHHLRSSNVDSIRYHHPTRTMQVKFKDSSIYQYEAVEPAVFMGFLRTHSPGQYRWYVLGDPRSPSGVHYSYKKVGGGGSALPPMPGRFHGAPFAIPKRIQKILKRKPGTGATGAYAVGVKPPPSSRKSP